MAWALNVINDANAAPGSIFRDGCEAAAARSAALHSVRADMIVANSARDYDPPI